MFQQSILTSLGSKFDEHQWVKQIRKTLDEELEEEMEIPVTIFAVPKPLMVCDPDSYIPQQVAIGPYHHLRLELYDMERYKVAAAKRIQRELNNVKLQSLVEHLIKHELRIRACYHRPINFGCEALAWMMAVDVCFLFDFIRIFGIKQGKILGKIPSGLSHLIDTSGNKPTHNSILKDILMLENQIPLFVMRMLLELQFSSMDTADEMLLAMMTGLSKDLSPFKTVENSEIISVKDRAHLLDFLYHFIVPKSEVTFAKVEIETEYLGRGFHPDDEKSEKEESFVEPSYLKQLGNMIWQALSSLQQGPIQWMKRVIFSKPLKFVVKLPWTILGKIPIIKMFKAPIENMLGAMRRDKEKNDDEESSSNSAAQQAPLQEEITIPSVTQLLEAGVQFVATNEGISSIKFDEKTLTLYFPVINLDVNSEVVLRNLVAYEACSASGPLILARYTELMNGIIDTEVDAKFLCGKGIIVNHLKSEKEVADLWNGMSKSVRLTKAASLDKVIADVNKFYSARWRVKLKKFVREYVFGSWKLLTFLAAIAMLLLMCLQAFCQVYACSRIFPIEALDPFTTPNTNTNTTE